MPAKQHAERCHQSSGDRTVRLCSEILGKNIHHRTSTLMIFSQNVGVFVSCQRSSLEEAVREKGYLRYYVRKGTEQ